MLTVTHSDNPLLPFARLQTVQLGMVAGDTLAEILTRAGLHPGSAPVVVTLNGQALADWAAVVPCPGDVLTLHLAAHGDDGGSSGVLGVVASIALMAAGQVWGAALGNTLLGTELAATAIGGTTLGAMVGSAVISIGGTLLLNALLPAPSAKLPSGSASSFSATYSLTGGANQARPYQPIMLVMGRHRVSPDISQKPASLFEGNENYLHNVFNYGLIPVAWSAHRIGDSPVASFDEITLVDGAAGAALPGIVQNVETVDGGGELDFDNDDWSTTQVGEWTTRTTAAATTFIYVNIAATVGCSYQSTPDGWDKVFFEIEWSPAGANTWAALAPTPIGGTYDTIRKSVRIDVPVGQYDVRVRATAGNGAWAPADPQSRTRQPVFISLVCLQQEPASFEAQYRLGVKIRASGQLQGTLDRWSSLCEARTAVWNGAAWVTAHTRNPAWWYIAVLRGARLANGRLAWGAGLADARIDVEAIKAWGAWCDVNGHTFDAVFDGPVSLAEMLNRIAYAGCASPSVASGKHGVVWQDRADVPVAVFGMFNIKAGTFEVNYISEGLADEIEATFANEDNDYQAETIRVKVPGTTGTPQRTARIDLVGIVNPAKALERARLEAAGQYFYRRRIAWETDAEGLMVQRGRVVMLSHDLTQWDTSGRLLGWDAGTRTLTLDREVDRTAADHIMLRWPNGHMHYAACPGTGTGNTVTLAEPLPVACDGGATALETPGSSQPMHDWTWQYGARPTPGKKVRIVSMAPASRLTVKIEAVDEEDGYYDWADGVYTPPATFALPSCKPVNLKATEQLLRLTPGGSISAVNLSWGADAAATYVIRAQLRHKNGEVDAWRDRGAVTGGAFSFEASEGDFVEIEVAPFFALKTRARYEKATTSLTVAGRTTRPDNVASLSLTLDGGRLTASWPAVDDIDVPQYELRRGGVADTWETAAFVGRANALQLPDPDADIGNWRYFVKARDVLGLTSVAAATADIMIAEPSAPATLTHSFYDTSTTTATITLDWSDESPALGLAHYAVTYNGITKTTRSSSITLPADWVGSRDFMVQTVDLRGNASPAITRAITKLAPNAPTGVRAAVIDNNVMLYWTPGARTTLPVSHALLKKGATWETAVVIGRKDGAFTTLIEMRGGVFTYWIAMVDTDGVESVPVSVSATVNEPPDFVFHGSKSSTLNGTLTSAVVLP